MYTSVKRGAGEGIRSKSTVYTPQPRSPPPPPIGARTKQRVGAPGAGTLSAHWTSSVTVPGAVRRQIGHIRACEIARAT